MLHPDFQDPFFVFAPDFQRLRPTNAFTHSVEGCYRSTEDGFEHVISPSDPPPQTGRLESFIGQELDTEQNIISPQSSSSNLSERLSLHVFLEIRTPLISKMDNPQNLCLFELQFVGSVDAFPSSELFMNFRMGHCSFCIAVDVASRSSKAALLIAMTFMTAETSKEIQDLVAQFFTSGKENIAPKSISEAESCNCLGRGEDCDGGPDCCKFYPTCRSSCMCKCDDKIPDDITGMKPNQQVKIDKPKQKGISAKIIFEDESSLSTTCPRRRLSISSSSRRGAST
ncbi:hypothetical protein L596_026105 [Steinernema carpocapsae]|uniref:Uncharacterized protein n=1 Tax=Steinernema carpocapsae TaxID=34508 RepID=A0A4U5M0E6_STECR|nr:hypothetical protein L596_026105 [Steinernema carpocapsae]